MFQLLYRHFGVRHGRFNEIIVILNNKWFLKSKALLGILLSAILTEIYSFSNMMKAKEGKSHFFGKKGQQTKKLI